jgi:AcrR family transcriptional regulator
MTKLKLTLTINPKIFLKDPTSTKLGQKILKEGIIYLDQVGLDDFNFRKLAQRIESTESSIYRYFENKHAFFVYMINWYWEWMSARIDINLLNIDDPVDKFRKVLQLLVDAAKRNTDTPYIDEDILHRVIVREGSKAYHHKLVDNENSDGFFLSYKALCAKIVDIILEINPDYKYPKSMSSMLIETANNNIYFAKHLHRLTDIKDSENMDVSIVKMLEDLSLPSILNTMH